VGNLKELQPGGEDTFMSYDLPWANASNAPFRLFKSWVHEGGIATPFIVHWPSAMTSLTDGGVGEICHNPWILMDIVATCCELGCIPSHDKLQGESFLPLLQGKNVLKWIHVAQVFTSYL
jgi:arylsulfatase